MKIKVLEDRVINQIAAGEVVERPLAVVRELVENSIDAGADSIEINIESGGKALIRVTDNGSGMEKDDALLSIERHATSKISDASDLKSICTLGFRGEALAAISAVSNMNLQTKTPESPVGISLSIIAGRLKDVKPVACSTGTTIEVLSLFINTPARKKFLKSDETEERKIREWVRQTAIAHPTVSFKLTNQNRQLINYRKVSTSEERAAEQFPESSVKISAEFPRCRIRGLLAHPSLAQNRAETLTIIVNGRVVSDRIILKAVKDGFSTTLKYQEFPVGYVSLEMSPEDLDVNVHPQKSEVRFSSPQHVYQLLRDSVHSAIIQFSTPVNSSQNLQRFTPFESSSAEFTIREPAVSSYNQSGFDFINLKPGTAVSLSESAYADEHTAFSFSRLKYIGQLLECYLVCEYAENFVLVDMHAAHERYNFNLVRNSFQNKNSKSQILLIPKAIELTEDGLANCLQHSEFLEKFGFEMESYGQKTLLLRAVPALLVNSDVTSLIKEISTYEFSAGAESAINKALDYVAARIACHASIRSGDIMNKEQAQALFIALDGSDFSAACPHGRPVVVEFPIKTIESWFGRDR